MSDLHYKAPELTEEAARKITEVTFFDSHIGSRNHLQVVDGTYLADNSEADVSDEEVANFKYHRMQEEHLRERARRRVQARKGQMQLPAVV